jgi:hypothetical protein
MHRTHPGCPGSDRSEHSATADLLVRQEPDEEEEEDEGNRREDDNDDDENEDGYSE